jgi:hypothetical protein
MAIKYNQMVLISIELPSGEIKKMLISDTITLQDIADILEIPSAIFFCYRFEGKLGTFMGYASNALFSTFNTDACVVLDSTKIPDKDQATVTKWLELFASLSSSNSPSGQR